MIHAVTTGNANGIVFCCFANHTTTLTMNSLAGVTPLGALNWIQVPAS